ncbi:restriction endonuclease subunit S [Stutzerimonas stutzeri]|uniref:Type I restriction endonuclease subunit S n=1 Tax=Stutzerimonas stutzeri KOS6 TaxID=1218352 RepID=A0A061JPL4_STUST|nr:restriction endonuclease subunit S [Stutzerimonas stutzeri]EWC41666.1 type I restriction endonuclease subunit S [Stutzerimonas stutzeri KOS6]
MNLVPFGSVCSLQNGRAFKPEEWSASGTPIVRIQNLNDESKPFNYCDFEVEKRFHVDSGDLLFSWSGTPGTSFGAFFWNRGKGFLNQHIFRVDIDERHIDKNYLRYAINSKLDLIIDQAHGGVGLKHITKGKLEAVEIPLPPLPEQKRIAAILDKADAIRRKRQQAIQLADDFLRAVFLDMFGDPVTNPKGWDLLPFSAVGTLDRGKSRHRPRNDPALLGGIHPLIQTGEVANSRGYIKEHSATYSDLGLAQSKKWDAGTLCITIAANIAKTGILTFPACFPDSVVGFIPNKHVTVEYVQHWLGFLQKNLEENAPQAAQKNINLEILRALLIPVPPKSEQEQFSSMVAGILAIEEKIASSSDALGNAFDALSQKAFSGQL